MTCFTNLWISMFDFFQWLSRFSDPNASAETRPELKIWWRGWSEASSWSHFTPPKWVVAEKRIYHLIYLPKESTTKEPQLLLPHFCQEPTQTFVKLYNIAASKTEDEKTLSKPKSLCSPAASPGEYPENSISSTVTPLTPWGPLRRWSEIHGRHHDEMKCPVGMQFSMGLGTHLSTRMVPSATQENNSNLQPHNRNKEKNQHLYTKTFKQIFSMNILFVGFVVCIFFSFFFSSSFHRRLLRRCLRLLCRRRRHHHHHHHSSSSSSSSSSHMSLHTKLRLAMVPDAKMKRSVLCHSAGSNVRNAEGCKCGRAQHSSHHLDLYSLYPGKIILIDTADELHKCKGVVVYPISYLQGFIQIGNRTMMPHPENLNPKPHNENENAKQTGRFSTRRLIHPSQYSYHHYHN